MRLIDAEEIRMAKVPYDDELSEYERGWNDACDAVADNAPTIDAVEVVRCKECKWYKDGWCYNPNTFDDEKTRGNTTADWFCADGERKC